MGQLAVFGGDKDLAALDANVRISDQTLEILELEMDTLKLEVEHKECQLTNANKKVDERTAFYRIEVAHA